MAEPSVHLNGRLTPRSHATVSIRDRAFRYGEGLFETMRACGERIFRLPAHLHRLSASADSIRWKLPWDHTELAAVLEELLRANDLPAARVRLQVSRGPGDLHGDDGTPTLLAEAEPFVPPAEDLRERGAHLAVSSMTRRAGRAGAKTTAYLENLLARRLARESGHDEALLLNDAGQVCEASMANLFVVRGPALLTPDVGGGALPGVTRSAVIEVAAAVGLEAREEALTLDAVISADEVFLTSTGIEVLPVTRLDGKTIGDGRPGRFSLALLAGYRRILDDELRPR